MVWRVSLLALGGSLAMTCLAEAQSLGEIARKERQRRAEVASGAPVVVIGDKELATSEGSGLSVTGRPVSVDSAEPASASLEDPRTDAGRLSAKEVRKLRETWNRVWKEQLSAAENELEVAKDHVFQCRSAGHYFFVPIAIDCDGVHERLAIAEYRLKEIKENQYNWELLLPETPNNAPPMESEEQR